MTNFNNIDISSLEAVSVKKLQDTVSGDAVGVKNAIYMPVENLAGQVNNAFITIKSNFNEQEGLIKAAQNAANEAKTEASAAQTAAVSKSCIMIGGLLKAELSYSKNTTRSSTVVVGMQSKGYTSDEVDYFVPAKATTAETRAILMNAFNAVAICGGKVILLEGEYVFDAVWCGIKGQSISIEGQGFGTKLTTYNTVRFDCPVILKNLYLNCMATARDEGSFSLNTQYGIFDSCYLNTTYACPVANGDLYLSNCITNNNTAIWLPADKNLYLSNSPRFRRAVQ